MRRRVSLFDRSLLIVVIIGSALFLVGRFFIVPPALATDCPHSNASVQLAAYGDSTTQGPDETHSMPFYLQPLLCDMLVTNEGVSGTRADQLLAGTDGRHLPWVQEMAQSKAHIILLNYGINDSRRAGETVSDYTSTMRELVRIAQAHGKQVVLETPNPIYPTLQADAPDDKLQQHAQAVRQIAKAARAPVIDVNIFMLQLVAQQPLKMLYGDSLHPLPPSYDAIAHEAAKVIETMLPSQ